MALTLGGLRNADIQNGSCTGEATLLKGMSHRQNKMSVTGPCAVPTFVVQASGDLGYRQASGASVIQQTDLRVPIRR